MFEQSVTWQRILSFARLNRRIGGNALLKLSSEVVGRIASFGLVLWAARRLTEADFGLYNYGLALGFVLAPLADFGLQVLLAREIAVMDKEARPLVVAALRLKLLFSLPALLVLVLLTAGWAGGERLALLALGVMMLAQTYVEFVAYVFRGQQALMVEARLLAAARLLTALLGGLVLWLGTGLLGLALSSLAVTAVFVIRSLQLLRRAGWLEGVGAVFFRGRQDTAGASPYAGMLRQALPLGVAIFLSIAYTRLAVLMLQYRLGEVAVAEFSAAYRLVEPGQIIPASLLAAVFPAFTLALHADPARAGRMGRQVSLLLGVLGVGVAVGFAVTAPWLIPVLYGGKFLDSIPVLQILGVSAIFSFVNYSLTHYLIARGQQATIGLFTGAMLALHAAVSWYLIPLLGIVGPAISIVIGEGVLFLCCLLTLSFTTPGRGSNENVAPSNPPGPDPSGSTPSL